MRYIPSQFSKPFECPYCGSGEGYFCHYWTKYCQSYNANGMADSAEGVDSKGGARLYCWGCEKNVTQTVKKHKADFGY